MTKRKAYNFIVLFILLIGTIYLFYTANKIHFGSNLLINGRFYREGVFYTKRSFDNTVYDKNYWISYVNNQVIIRKKQEVSDKKIKDLIKNNGAKVLFHFPFSNDYKVSFIEDKTYSELNSECEKIRESDDVECVSLILIVNDKENEKISQSRNDYISTELIDKKPFVFDDPKDFRNLPMETLYSMISSNENTIDSSIWDLEYINNICNNTYVGSLEFDEILFALRAYAKINYDLDEIVYDGLNEDNDYYTYTIIDYGYADHTTPLWSTNILYLVECDIKINKSTMDITQNSRIIGDGYTDVNSDLAYGIYGNEHFNIPFDWMNRIFY